MEQVLKEHTKQIATLIGATMKELTAHRDGSFTYQSYFEEQPGAGATHGERLEAARQNTRELAETIKTKAGENGTPIEILVTRARKEPGRDRYVRTIDFRLVAQKAAAAGA